MSILYFLIVGIVSGWLAGKLMKGSGFGPGQSHVKSLSEQDFGEVGVVPAGGEAFVFDADFERRFVF